MPTKLIKLDDGLLMEVDVPEDQAQQISGGMAQRVAASMEKIRPVLHTVVASIKDSWDDLSKDVRVQQAELEIGLSFEGEGNLYVTKAKAGANFTVRLVFGARDE